MQVGKLCCFIILDIILMLIGTVIPISNYNGIINGLFCIPIIIFLYKKGHFLLFIFFSTCYFFLISQYKLYCIFDCFTIIIVIGLVSLFGEYLINRREFKVIQTSFIFLFATNLLMAFLPSKYMFFDDEVRYMGIFNACNLSVSVMTICGVVIWEIEKKIHWNPRKRLLIFNIVGFIILIFATRTRTVLFLLPYWLYQSYRFLNKKMFIGSLIIVGSLFASTILQSLNERMNLEGDASSATRASIYIALIDGILENNLVLPHGSNEAFFYIKNFTGDSGFSSHNDYLRYMYDWGAYFFLFLSYLVLRIKKYVHFDAEYDLILLGYSALALHNMLFLPITWIPFCIILNLRTKHILD